MRKRPTLADVARAAGVSKTTASLALNGKDVPNVSDATRAAIAVVARDLGFRPHGVARALSRRRADVIGVVGKVDPFVHESQHLFEHGLLSAIFRRTLESGYNPLIYGFPAAAEATDEHALSRYADGRSDALLLLNPPVGCPLTRYLHDVGIPTVSLCSRDPNPRGLWVDSDNESGIRALVAHLVERGHRHMAYFVGPADEDNARTRTEAFRMALREHELQAREDWIVAFKWHFDKTRAAVDGLLYGQPAPTAMLVWNDYAAEDICRALRQRGLRVPADVSVVGFDDTPSARAADPPLTTVKQDLTMLGRTAVDLALAALAGDSDDDASEPPVRSAICPVELVVRGSTAIAR